MERRLVEDFNGKVRKYSGLTNLETNTNLFKKDVENASPEQRQLIRRALELGYDLCQISERKYNPKSADRLYDDLLRFL